MEESKSQGGILDVTERNARARRYVKNIDPKIGQWVICLRFSPDVHKVGVYTSSDAPAGKVTLPQGHIIAADTKASRDVVCTAAERILKIKLGAGRSGIPRDSNIEYLVSFRAPCPARLADSGYEYIDYHVVVSLAGSEDVSLQNGSHFAWEDPELLWEACRINDDTYLSPCKRMIIAQAFIEFAKKPRDFHRALQIGLRDMGWFQRVFRNIDKPRLAA